MSTKPSRTFQYSVAQDRAARVSVDGKPEVELGDEWKPEHLVLAGLVRCTLESLRFHASRAGIDFVASASAAATVTRRGSDERYAFTEISVELELELDPEPDDVPELLAAAERDCFVGASLTAKPRYSWRVNGAPVGSQA
ncbi:MAG: OsmC-like protein [Gaiellaceae bacterium]|nr:OsmC-like protein [Gaiellaceae bacterium]MDX6483257.1 OsmC-like protein [Gaiellaceae bacterium]MDX6492916.1 OsmC-like protein [Gaiellaceae bacterium]